ncbi:MAG: arginase family protein [Bacteroidia bacterium]|nr:arginase family protein [Bacteroidia bacterium]
MENIVLNLSGLPAQERIFWSPVNAMETDLTGLEGTNCYCDETAAAAIRSALSELPVHAVHWIDSGDYHYISRFWLEKAALENPGRPFALVLFDHHPDMQEPAFEGVFSCGGWARDSFTGIEELKQVLMLGINPDLEIEILDLVFDGVLAVTSDDFRHTGDAIGQDVIEMLSLLDPGIPVYVSIDLDVLSGAGARTNWDQGVMTIAQMEAALKYVAASHEILGVDVCGGLTREKGAKDEDLELNAGTRRRLAAFVDNLVER